MAEERPYDEWRIPKAPLLNSVTGCTCPKCSDPDIQQIHRTLEAYYDTLEAAQKQANGLIPHSPSWNDLREVALAAKEGIERNASLLELLSEDGVPNYLRFYRREAQSGRLTEFPASRT